MQQPANHQKSAANLLHTARTLASSHRMDMLPASAARMQARELRGELDRLEAAAGDNHAVRRTTSSAREAIAAI